jgi:hypothetical protein
MAQLPEIKLTCRTGHTFASRARGSMSVSCPECKKDGQQVSVWIPKNRPKTITRSRAAAGDDGQGDAALAEMMARWAHEPAWDGKTRFLPGRPGRDECTECGELVQWEPGRTLIYCPPCKLAGLPPAVAEHYTRKEQRSTEVAARTTAAADPAAVRAARVRIRALKQRMINRLSDWIDAFDPDELSGHAERLALDYHAELTAYLPEIKNADSDDELAEIMAEITEITGRAASSGALAEIERQRDALARADELAERQAEWDQQAEREARQAERDAQEAARRAAIEARTQRKAIEAPATRVPIGYVGAAASLIAMIEQRRSAKEQKIDRNGACGYQHRKPEAAERRYWITTLNWQGNQSGQEPPNAPSVSACQKHFAMAEAWIQEQAAMITGGRMGIAIQAVHTELT